MTDSINRATGFLIIEVVNSNPNADPDRESDPRQRSNGFGEISPVSFKRKLRDLTEDADGPVFRSICERMKLNKDHFKILEARGRVRSEIAKEMGGIGKFDPAQFKNSLFVKKYWDGRLFGNTFLEEGGDKGYIKTGVAQFGMGISVAPILILRHTNTNRAGVEGEKKQGMAPLGYRVVEHGVYCLPFYINPSYAHKSGCTPKDIEVLKALIPYAYDHTRSAIRPDVRIRYAWYMEHSNPLGSCADYLLIEALTPKRKGNDLLKPSTSWSDYEVPEGLPDNLSGKVSFVDLMNDPELSLVSSDSVL
jgi:CRISPR-associated protein Csd2